MARLRLVADEFTDFRDIRHPPRHVLEAGLVGLIVGDVMNRRAAAGHRLHARGKVGNRDLTHIADVEHLTDGALIRRQPHERLDDVADVGEAA